MLVTSISVIVFAIKCTDTLISGSDSQRDGILILNEINVYCDLTQAYMNSDFSRLRLPEEDRLKNLAEGSGRSRSRDEYKKQTISDIVG